MTNWAIIVGINKYPALTGQGQTLFGAVADAVDFADWALHPDGGAVEPERLFFWTYPAPTQMSPRLAAYMANPTPWATVPFLTPDSTRPPNVVDIGQVGLKVARAAYAANMMAEKPEVSRCYILLAGHGVQAPVLGRDSENKPCYLAGDYVEGGMVVGLLPCEDLRNGMLANGMGQVIMFLDCCRTTIRQTNLQAPPLVFPYAPLPPKPTYGLGYAVQGDESAWETPFDAPTRGAFTKVLVDGLRQLRDSDAQTLNLEQLQQYVEKMIVAAVQPKTQSPFFDWRPRPPPLPLVTGPPIPLPAAVTIETINIDLSALAPGTTVHLRDEDDLVIKSFVAGAAPVSAAGAIGRMYTLETDDGTVLEGFLHSGPGMHHAEAQP